MQLSSLPGPLDKAQRRRLRTWEAVEGQSSTPRGQLCHQWEFPGLKEGNSGGRWETARKDRSELNEGEFCI